MRLLQEPVAYALGSLAIYRVLDVRDLSQPARLTSVWNSAKFVTVDDIEKTTMKTITPNNSKTSRMCARIMKSVRARGRGAAFTSRDFAAFGSSAAVRQALSRLTKRGVLRRVARGLYDWPPVASPVLASLGIAVAPDVSAVVAAIARRDNARIQLDGAQAANALGLSTQVPARDSYRSSGRSHRIALGKTVIQIRHAPPRLMAARNQSAALTIGALSHLGAHDVDSDDIAHLHRVLDAHGKTALRRAAPKTYRWMRPILAKITAE